MQFHIVEKRKRKRTSSTRRAHREMGAGCSSPLRSRYISLRYVVLRSVKFAVESIHRGWRVPVMRCLPEAWTAEVSPNCGAQCSSPSF